MALKWIPRQETLQLKKTVSIPSRQDIRIIRHEPTFTREPQQEHFTRELQPAPVKIERIIPPIIEEKKITSLQEAFAELKQFPVFQANQYKPLAIGIDKEIRKRLNGKVLKATLNRCLSIHTNKLNYLKKLKAGRDRFDLDNNPVGHVTEKQEQKAKEILDEIQLKKTKSLYKKEEIVENQENH